MKRVSAAAWVGFLVMAFFVIPSGVGAGQDEQIQEPDSIIRPAKKLRIELLNRPKAPDFTLKNLSGKDVRLSDFLGKVVLMNFWTTW